MNKGELINAVSDKTGVPKKDVDPVINGVMSIIRDKLKEGERVQLLGFGTFLVRERKARKGRNPITGEEMDIAAAKVPVFRAGKLLRAEVADANPEPS